MTIQQICDRAGVRMLLTNNGSYEPGDTVAITAIAALVKKHTAMKARQILEVLANAELAPIGTPHVKAVELLMSDPDYCDQFEPEDLTREIATSGKTAEHEAKLFSVAQKVPLWKALAITWFKKTRKKRKVAA